jgi:peptidoglycan/xylan/chitin deacetylase (PgdA/CDA1 family)
VTPGGRLLAGGSALAVGAGLAHALPAVTTWRELRCLLTPGLAGVGDPHHVALTFDDGPDPASTPAILDGLERLHWRATFFLLGSMVRRSPALAHEVAARGHEVGVHGDGHRSHLRQSPAAIGDDVRRCRDLIAEATGVEARWFRPPYGTLSGGSLAAAVRLGLRTVLWTTWGRDWREEATPATVVDDVAKGLRPGATVLLHDSDCTSAPQSWRATLGALPELATLFAARGLEVGPLGEHGLSRAASNRTPPSGGSSNSTNWRR